MLKEHKPIYDKEINEFILKSLRQLTNECIDLQNWSTEYHLSVFESWIFNSTRRSISGLKNFSYRAICSGTSAAIENFINRNQHRRLRFSQSEFALSKIVCNANSISWTWLESEEIKVNDAVVISWPFSGNGNTYPNIDELIKQCEKYNVPVLIDAAYFGISDGIEILTDNQCITDVCVSLSKPFSTMLRHGIRFTRIKYDDVIQNSNDLGILNRSSVVVASDLMRNFNSDYIVDKYIQKNKTICQKNNIIPSPTITLANGDKTSYPEFCRGNFVRLCITDELML
jgi:hypothetical protein